MPALEDVLKQRLSAYDSQAGRRMLTEVDRQAFPVIEIGDKSLISFSCNDYLGLSMHPDVLAAVQSSDRSGAGASRLVTGNHSVYAALEHAIAEYKQTEAALVFGSGYMANIGIIPAIIGAGDLVLSDKLAHACMLDGVKLSGAMHKRFAHNDLNHLERLLQTHRGDAKHCLIVTETVFSMDGDVAPIDDINELAEQYDAWVMSDDAHGLGIVSSPATDIQMGTLSKSVGGYGGYVCGSQILVDYLVNSARSLIFTTALPEAIVRGNLAAFKVMSEEVERGQQALEHARYFTKTLGLPMAQSCIVPLIIGDAQSCLNASKTLSDDGFWVSAIRPPTVPQGTARLRFTFSALHNKQQIDQLIESISAHGWLSQLKHQRLDAAS